VPNIKLSSRRRAVREAPQQRLWPSTYRTYRSLRPARAGETP
jgi:hypothetical protein